MKLIVIIVPLLVLVGCVNSTSTHAPSYQANPEKKGLSFMCKDAISRQDEGAIDVFCQDMDFMLRESIKQNNPGGVDVFGNDIDFMCKQAIKNQDKGGIFVFCQ